MQKLPKEVLFSILSYVDSIDKVTCLQVCKHLYDTVSVDLYKELEFYDLGLLQEAIAMFKNRGKLGHHTNSLAINHLDLDAQSILCLPSLFPNIKTLNWRENNSKKKQDNSLKDMDAQYLCLWKHLETIIDRPKKLNVSTRLLGLCTFYNLKILQVSFADCSMFKHDRPNRSYIKDLLHNIGSAPNLNQLTISETVIDLEDMELLHSSVPELQELTLDTAYVLTENLVTVNTVAYRLKSFTLSFGILGTLSIAEITDNLIEWIKYSGEKYNHLEHIKLGHDLLDINSNESDAFNAPSYEYSMLEWPTINALLNMPNIRSYAIQATYITAHILDTLNNNCSQLKNLQLYLENDNQMQHDFQLLSSYPQLAERIEALTITRISCGKINGISLSHSLSVISSAISLANLVSLKLENIFNNGRVVLLNILKYFPRLETLHFNLVGFKSLDYEDPMDTMHKCRVKELKLHTFGEKIEHEMSSINQYFNFVLQSCPQLEKFDLSGVLDFYQPGDTFDLNFVGHAQLKYIGIELEFCQYFTFDHESRKHGTRWIDYHRPLKQTEQEISYHAHLAWRGRVALDLINLT